MSDAERENLVYVPTNKVVFATNTFINVPIILQYEDEPLIETVSIVDAGYTAQFNLYNQDGVRIAVAKGNQLYKTSDGEKSNLVIRYPDKRTVAELDGKTLFEISRNEAAALNLEAELFTHQGTFLRCHDSIDVRSIGNDEPLALRGMVLSQNIFSNMPVGVTVRSDSISIGGF